MDLDDSFTEGLLRSIKARRDYINEKKADILSSGKKRAAFNEDPLENSDVPPEESPKRQCTGMSQMTFSKHNKENIELMDETTSDFVPFLSASKTRGLAALKKKYSNDDDDDDDDNHGYSKASEQQVNRCNKFIFSTNSSDLCAQSKQKSRLADLAANIKQWEDDTHTPTLSSKNVTSTTNTTKFQMPQTNTPNSTNKTFSMKVYYTSKQSSDTFNTEKHDVVSNYQRNIHPYSSHGNGPLDSTPACKKGNIEVGSVKGKWGKQQAWDQAVMATLDTPTSANSAMKNSTEISAKEIRRNIKPTPDSDAEDHSDQNESIDEDDFAENYDDIKSDDEASKMEFDICPTDNIKQQEKPNEVKKFEASKESKPLVLQETTKSNVDPAELPLSARRALFEKAFINGTPKINDDAFDHKLSVAQRAAMFENASKATSGVKTTHFKEPKRMAFSNFEKFEKRNTNAHKSPVKSVQPATKSNFQEIKGSPVKQVFQTVSPMKQAFQTASPAKQGYQTASPAKQGYQTASPAKQGYQTASPVKQAFQSTSPLKQAFQTASPLKQAFQTASPMKQAFQTASPMKQAFQTASPAKNTFQTTSPVKKISNFVSPITSPTKNVGSHTRLIQQKLMENSASNWQEKQAAKAAEERKQEISSLVNHWEKISSSSTENNSELEKAPLASEERFTCKSDTIYETTENEESEVPDSENEDVSEYESKYDSVEKESEYSDNDEQDDVSSMDERSETLNAEFKTGSLTSVTENTDVSYSNESDNMSFAGQRSSCYSDLSSIASDSNYHASNSQSCSTGSSVRSYDFTTSKTEEVFPEKFEKKENKNPEINILRTVSAYRREKQETKLTPVRTVVRREKVSSPESPPDTDFTEVIQQRLKELQDEVLRQQIIISQTSQALNLCSATAEFSGSTEQVEGERLLLIATQKRQACLNEIQRLKTYGAQGENVIEGTGTLTITDLQLPLKREFIAAQLEGRGTDTVHYFLCLIRHGAQVIVTQMISTDERSNDGTLNFTNHIQIRNLPADFSVVFEVYALQTKKEVLPHEKKYHIKRENSKRRLTPKGKKADGKMPAIYSPGGPNAVRSPSFGVVGYTRFNLQNSNKKTFTLDKVPFTSPLEGVLRVQIQLHAEHKVALKGFLTFYEDVGEIGALYRRWCVLDGRHIMYWLYPDDEHKKEPLGSIDLRQCVTGTVKLVSTLECARSHTFKLVVVRPQKKGDRDTLISRTVNTLTTTKHLLTADTKDERILWCNKINEALENVRKWDPKALRSIETINI